MLDTLKRWFKIGSPQPPGDPVTFPYTHTAPDGNLTVTVHSLSLDRCGKMLPCWGYESKGLMAFGQKELLLLLKREPGESESDFVRDPLGFFVNVARFAQEGKIVTSGGFTQFGARGGNFCGRHYLLYSFLPEGLKGLHVLQTPVADMLLCHLLHDDEGEAVKAWGETRVLSRLGHAATYYPFPDWNDRKRKPLPIRKDMAQSLLTQMPQLHLPEATAYFEESTTNADGLVTLRVPASALARVRSALDEMPEPMPLAFITGWEPSATGCFVWEAGQKEPLAIIPPNGGNARINGNFVLITPTEDDMDEVRTHEDGFGVLLTPPSYQRVVQAFRDATPVTLAANQNRFSLYFPG